MCRLSPLSPLLPLSPLPSQPIKLLDLLELEKRLLHLDRARQGSTGFDRARVCDSVRTLLDLLWSALICFDLLWSALLFLNVSQLPCCFSMFMALLFVAAGQLQELTLTIRAHDPWSWWCYAFWSPSLAQISWKRGGLTQSTKHSIPTIPTHFKKLFLWQRTIK